MIERAVAAHMIQADEAMRVIHDQNWGQHHPYALEWLRELAEEGVRRHVGPSATVETIEKELGYTPAVEAATDVGDHFTATPEQNWEAFMAERARALGVRWLEPDSREMALAKTIICAEVYARAEYQLDMLDGGLSVDERRDWVADHVQGNPYEDGREAAKAWGEKHDLDSTADLMLNSRGQAYPYPMDEEQFAVLAERFQVDWPGASPNPEVKDEVDEELGFSP